MTTATDAGHSLAVEIAVCLLLSKSELQLQHFEKLAHELVAQCFKALPTEATGVSQTAAAAEFMIAARRKLTDLAAMAQAMRTSPLHRPGEHPEN